jgi:hypothetical protein
MRSVVHSRYGEPSEVLRVTDIEAPSPTANPGSSAHGNGAIKARVQHRLLCRCERRRCGVFIRLALIDRFRSAKRRLFQPLGTTQVQAPAAAAKGYAGLVIRTSPDLFAHWPLVHGNGRTLGAV